MPDRENVIAALHCRAYDDDFPCWKCAYYKQDEKPVARCDYRGLMDDAIALLKEQEAVVKQWTKEIADYQLAHAPKDSHEFMSLDEHLENEYKRGIWDGLQIAWNIISEGR